MTPAAGQWGGTFPAVSCTGGITLARFFVGRGGSQWVDANLHLTRGGEVELEDLLGDDAGAVESMVEPEVGGERVMRGRGDDAVFEDVAGLEAEDANGFDADVLVGGRIDDGRIGIVGDGAG